MLKRQLEERIEYLERENASLEGVLSNCKAIINTLEGQVKKYREYNEGINLFVILKR